MVLNLRHHCRYLLGQCDNASNMLICFSYKHWVSLTSHMDPDIVEALQPTKLKICSATQLESNFSTTQSRAAAKAAAAASMADSDAPRTSDGSTSEMHSSGKTAETAKAQSEDDLLPEMKQVSGTEIRFTSIPKRSYPDGASPAEITKYSMDHSYVLNTILSTKHSGGELALLGELQFAFVCFLLGQVYDGFEQWKQLVRLLCFCDEALVQHTQLFSNFINVMHYHIREIPEDFFVDIVTRDNFLVSCLHTFFENLLNSDMVDRDLKTKGDSFLKNLEKKFQWDFSGVLEDEAPVVVE